MISVKNLRFTYPKNETPTIKGIDFELEKGTSLGFLGPSGAGKSTCQKVLIKLLKQFEGDIQILGKDIRSWNSDFYNHVGVGFELPNTYTKLTGLENLRFFASFYDKPTQDPKKLLDMVGLGKDANKRVSDYSKGMKMRLNFIRALLHEPEILFFDEPTAGLDPVNARNIKDLILAEKAKGKTLFITTHNMYSAEELCDTVAFIVDGEIKALDTPQNLSLQAGEPKLELETTVDNIVQKIEFPLEDLGNNQAFLKAIQNPIRSIHSKEATLEEVFIKVTGKKLK